MDSPANVSQTKVSPGNLLPVRHELIGYSGKSPTIMKDNFPQYCLCSTAPETPATVIFVELNDPHLEVQAFVDVRQTL